MIERAIRFCVRNPFLVLVVAVLMLALGWRGWITKTVDAIPDISENQTVVMTEWPGRSPQDVEDQITYPLASQLAGVRGVKEVRGLSGFGFSQVYVVFEDRMHWLPKGAVEDFYDSRTRVLEKLASIGDQLPEGVAPALGPDATALGQIFWYTVDGPYDLASLRAAQDFVVKYALQGVAGVAEVASVGGMVRQYQVDVDPIELRHFGATVSDVQRAIRRSNVDVGAKTVESGGMESVVRGLGFLRGVEDLEEVVVGYLGDTGFVPAAGMGGGMPGGMSAMNGGMAGSRGAPKGRGPTTADVTRRSESATEIVRLDRLTGHMPVRVRDLADVSLGPEFRRGALANEYGERVGGVVVMRFGENPLDIIRGVREVITRLNDPRNAALPEGMRVVPFYDRTQLIDETVATLETALSQELVIAILVVVLFLLHVRTAIVIALTLPAAVLLCFLAMQTLGIDSNLMSLTGIAIAIGTMIDMGVVMAENIYRHLSEPREGETRSRARIVEDAAVEVGPALLTAVLTTVVSFLPIFFLTDQEGKLFRPLAWTKTLALLGAAITGIFLVPVMCRLVLANAKLRPLEDNPVSRAVHRAYEPTLRWVLGHKAVFMLLPLAIVLLGALTAVGVRSALAPVRAVVGDGIDRLRPVAWLEDAFPGLGQEFMPPLDEGSLLYMPSLLPAASLSQTLEVMQRQIARMKTLPEVVKAVGKLGRAESALDPAPVAMIETVVTLAPRSTWRSGVTKDSLVEELMDLVHTPGSSEGRGAWLQPIETRVIMLQSGIRAPMAVKLIGVPKDERGRSLDSKDGIVALESAATELREAIAEVPGVAGPTVENLGGKPYLESSIDREKLGHYGIAVGDMTDTIEAAVGGKIVGYTVEGRERYSIRVAYPRELRGDVEALGSVLVRGSGGVHVPMSQVAELREVIGPAAIKTEDGMLRLHVTFAASGRDEGSVMTDVLERVREWRADRISAGQGDPIPAGVSIEAAGRYESQIRARARFLVLIPICLGIIFLLLYLQFRGWLTTLNVFAAVPVTIAGGLLMLHFFPGIQDALYSLGLFELPSGGPIYVTVAVVVGFIALLGIATDDGVLMATYLEQTRRDREPTSVDEIRRAVVEAGLRRIRPCLMTTFTTVLALLPILASTGRGSDVARPMALPAVGGMLVSLVSLFVVPCVYCWVQEVRLRHATRST